MPVVQRPVFRAILHSFCCKMKFAPSRIIKMILTVTTLIYATTVLITIFYHRKRCKTSQPFYLTLEETVNDTRWRGFCPLEFEKLGVVNIDIKYIPPFEITEKNNPNVQMGGAWKPTGCQSLQKLAIIIPYRDRESHLKTLLARLHPMLQRQMIDYRIFVVEQYGQLTYNKGKLMNIGFIEALKTYDFNCFIFHDVDLIPENDKNIYQCDVETRHLSPAIDEMRYSLIYENLVGGVFAINPHNFRRVNGYSNMYWGWGGEDDDLAARTEVLDLTLSRPPNHIGRFKMIRHKKSKQANNAVSLFFTWESRWTSDGLNNAETMAHRIVSTTQHKLYTHIMVDVGKPDENILEKIAHLPRQSVWWQFNFYHP